MEVEGLLQKMVVEVEVFPWNYDGGDVPRSLKNVEAEVEFLWKTRREFQNCGDDALSWRNERG